MVKEKVRRTAFQYLLSVQETHSKVSCIKYETDFKIQPYLKDPSFKNKEKQLLFSLRTRMLREAKENFRSMYPDGTICDICDTGESQSQRHLLESCDPIIATCKEVSENVTIDHDYVYGTTKQQLEVTKLFSKVLEAIEQIKGNANN